MWLINMTIPLSSFAHESYRVAIWKKRFAKFLVNAGQNFYNSSTRQRAVRYLNNYLLIGNAAGPTIWAGWERPRALTDL